MTHRPGLGLAAASMLTAGKALAVPSDSSMAMSALAPATSRLASLRTDWSGAPDELRRFAALTSDALMSGAGVRSVTYVLILLLIGVGVEWLYRTYASAPLKVIDVAPAASRRDVLRLALRRIALIGFGLALFALATIGASAAFSWPPGVHDTVVTTTFVILFIRLAWALADFLFAPKRPRLRLVDVDSRRAGWLAATLIAIATLAAAGGLFANLLERLANLTMGANALRLAAATLVTILMLVALLFAKDRNLDSSQPRFGRRLPRFPRRFVTAFLVVATYALWLMSGSKAAAVLAILSIVIGGQFVLRAVVFSFWKDPATADGDSTGLGPPGPILVPSIVLAAARLVVLLLGVGALAITRDMPMQDLVMSDNPLVRLGFRVLEVIALALLANVAWIALRTRIDQRLERIGTADPREAAGPNARLLTLLPLLRVVAAIVLVVMLGLCALWALGIEITPLLAGAGVVGLALGFGAQALVRDVIAGIFYLAEDVFRLGEYIESGATTKGTVERITLRTVALRHHNGPLHFVPYGSLGTVRNNSRDWVIEKFNLPLPIHVDSEQIRKLIKKVGEGLMQDPEFGPMIRAPLKGKLYRIDPGVKIFRCSFETAPGKQFAVRAQAYKRIEARLKEVGIRFAEGGQTVIVQQPSESAGIKPAPGAA